MTGLEIINY